MLKKLKNRKNLIIVILSLIIAAAGVLCAFLATFGDRRVLYADDSVDTYTFHSANDFSDYASEYASGQHNRYDTLRFMYSTGETLTDEDFVSLGTVGRPFAGTVFISTVGIDVFYIYDSPLFEYVSSAMQITGTGVIKLNKRESGGLLFANHVVQEPETSGVAVWNISFEGTDDLGSEDSYSGLIGDIGDGCDITINYTVKDNLKIVAGGNAGLICGTLGRLTGASLAVSTTGSTASSIKVTTAGGHAGGLVGEMKTGSALQFKSANNSGVTEVTTTGSGYYAGGIVGYVDDAEISFAAGVTDYTVKGTVKGTTGAGGLFGYYKAASHAATTLSLANYSLYSGLAVSSTGNSGGIFGMLENNAGTFVYNGNAENTTITVGGTSLSGGVIGLYSTNALSNTLQITNVINTVTISNALAGGTGISGGIIGGISNNAAYVLFDGETGAITTSSGASGGLVGTEGSGGSFIDVKGAVTVTGSHHGGIVYTLQRGVLRLKGDTNLSGATIGSTDGLIVKLRDRSLIYSLGSGTDYGSGGWTLTRKSGSDVDDIYSWGQVVRTGASGFTESDLFTVNMTAHTVTVKSAATEMGTKLAFAKTALNIQLNTAAAVGALQFASAYTSALGSATLLTSDLTITANISLAGTGIDGFTRDDGENNVFTGSLDGGNKTITLDIGVGYGVNYMSGGVDRCGIHQHRYVGLFAKAGKAAGVAISDITVNGTINIRPYPPDNSETYCKTYAGSLVAQAESKVTLTDVTVSTTMKSSCRSSYASAYVGGAVGNVSLNGSVIVSGGVYEETFTDSTNSTGDAVIFGGIIGNMVGSATEKAPQTVSITDDAELSSSFTQENVYRTPFFGAAIGRIEHANYVKDVRTVTINSVDVNFTASGTPKSSKMGAILGTDWYATDVSITALRIDDTSITATTNSLNMGGLVQTATGHWDIISLSVDSDNDHDVILTAPSGSTFGFVANKTFYSGSTDATRSCLYLDVDNTGSNYNIGNLYIGASNNLSGNFTVFDELVADSRYNATDITDNGQSVISVTTTDGAAINFDDTACNTYQNKTVAGKAHVLNGRTRYYYNLKAIRTAGSPTNAQKFLIWSVGIYAHKSIKTWFTLSAFTGSLDMTGLSYYPVNLNGTSVTFTSATLKLDNNGIEAAEAYSSGGSDAVSRGTRTNTSQHYLMHTSTFMSVTGRISINGLTIQGNVPKLSNSFCGFLIAKTLGGATGGVVTHNDGVQSNIVFDGAYISTGTTLGTSADYTDNNFTTNAYAPLFINNVLQNSTVAIVGASQSTSAYSSYEGSGYYAGSSLIGDVGSNTAKSIRLSFEKLKFDGRKADITNGTTNSAMDASNWYGTGRSIFSRATILNSFLYLEQSSGTYNFTWEDEWNGSPAAHKVTYGMEITQSVENAGDQNQYYADASGRFVDPTSNANTTAEFGEFTSTYFLPYVYTAYDLENKKHELSVNIFIAVPNITGCGKYGDPYVITDGNMLHYVATVINGSVMDTATGLTLPADLTSSGTAGTAHIAGDTVYKYDSGYFKAAGKSDVTLNAVRLYLAGAYYQIKLDRIELPTNFPGLGVPDTDDANKDYYAFRGVITGHPDYDNVISNASEMPLVYNSNGCVIKDVTVEVNCESDIIFNYTSYTGSFEYLNGAKAYGAVIGQVMGGDTIIDNVSVTYTTATFSFNDTVYTRLAPIGGYIGVVLNGGVIFRNMAGKVAENFANKLDRVDDSGYLYVNPVIGRVIAGYAFHETTGDAAAYHPTEETATLKNTNKNYSIPDFNAKTFNTLNVSGNNINVYDGQNLFILSVIVNSGAGSATSSSGNYNALSAYWQAYRAYCTTRSTAKYNDIGNESDDYDLSCNDGYSGTNRTPYIITKYSTADARKVSSNEGKTIEIRGRCELPESFRGIGSIYINDPFVRIRAANFRGYNGTQYEIVLNTRYVEYNVDRINGSLAYKFYDTTPSYGYWVETSIRAIGIINQFISTNTTGAITLDISNLKLAGSVYADLLNRETGAALTEYLFSPLANKGGETDPPLPAPAANGIGGIDGVSVTVGGFIGCILHDSTDSKHIPKVNVDNLDFNGIRVQGPKWAGGLVGAGRGNKNNVASVSFTNCDTIGGNSISVKAGHQAGGLIGRSRQIAVNVNSSSGSSTLQIGEIVCMGNTSGATVDAVTYPSAALADAPKDGAGQNEESYSCGGVTAYARQGLVTVKNLTLTDGWIKHNVMANDGYIGFAGGVIGHNFQTKFSFTSVTVSGVNFDAEVTGGLIGGFGNNLNSNCSINSCLVDGLNTATIEGRNKAGGLFGIAQIGESKSIEISSTTVKRYTISQTYEISSGTNYASAGGLCAHVVFASNGTSLKLFDDCVTDCTVSSNYRAAATGRGTGGLIGVVTGSAKNVNGYDLFVNNTVISSYVANADDASQNCGIFAGKNDANCIFKLVGITYKDITTNGSTPMTGESYVTTGALLKNGSSYAVFADYDGATAANAFSPINSASNVNSNVAVYPYVTTNPTFTIGDLNTGADFVLTGDGVAADVASLPIQTILVDGLSGRYAYAANYKYSNSVTTKNLTLFDTKYKKKLEMFSVEALSYSGVGANVDFPILVIDSNDSATVTEMINSYIRLLTNTRISYENTTDQTNYNFAVNFFRMVYANNEFTLYDTEQSLVNSGGYFKTAKNYYDSGKNQFTLIDVAFKNPANNSQIAYHLYIPAFVRRVLTYRFDIAVRSGTTYIEKSYSPYYGQMLIENIGSSVTMYFKYTYQRSAEDWLANVNGGENLHRNFAKVLQFRKANNSAILEDFDDDTVLTLIDPNSGKAYYARVGDALAGNVLYLSAFRSEMTKSGDVLIFSGDYFLHVKFDDLLGFFEVMENADGPLIGCAEGSATVKIGEDYYCPYESGEGTRYSAIIVASSAATAVGGAYVDCTATPADATVRVGANYYRLYTDSDGAATRYDITLNGEDIEDYLLSERYYISIFTEAAEDYDDFHHYIINAPGTFGDSQHPSVISDTGTHTMVHLVMGKIFDHSGFSVTSESKDSTPSMIEPRMTAENNRLDITLQATFGVSDDLGELKEEVKGFIGATEVYQSFIVNLNRTDGNSTVKAILGNPTCAGTYSIDGGADVDYTVSGTVRETQNYAEFVSQDLATLLSTSPTAITITADVSLTYTASAVLAQFPGRDVNAPDNGVTVSGSSNLAFSLDGTTYTKNTQTGEQTPSVSYYSDANVEVAVLDLNPIGDKVGDFTPLGINALNNDNLSYAQFDLLAVLDATAVYESIVGYQDAVMTVTLTQKQADGSYGSPLNLSTYITAFSLEDVAPANVTNNGTSYTAIIAAANINDLGAALVMPTLHFTVKTGSAFESAGLTYGNFKITVDLVLRDVLENEYSVSRVSEFIIYTNAKIIPDYITD